MFMSASAFLVNLLANFLLVRTLGWGLVGSALALCCAYLCMVLFLLVLAGGAGLGGRVWGCRMERQSRQQLWEYAALGYSSIGLRSTENLTYTFNTILAGFLPNPDVT